MDYKLVLIARLYLILNEIELMGCNESYKVLFSGSKRECLRYAEENEIFLFVDESKNEEYD